jgi:hypothetical protein
MVALLGGKKINRLLIIRRGDRPLQQKVYEAVAA